MSTMMRDMVRHIAVSRGYIKEEHAQPTFLDTYQKWSTTNDPLPDREMQYHKFADSEGYGHEQPLHEVPLEHRSKFAPNATHATRLYGPSRTVLHGPGGDVTFHHDEPDFQKVTHELHHMVGKLNQSPGNPNRFVHIPLHTDIIHSKTYTRNPNETAQQFSSRIHNSIENESGEVHTHNEMEDGLDAADRTRPHHVHAFMDPLETWQDNDKPHNENVVIGHGGQLTHETIPQDEHNGRFRHGQITQDFHHVIKVHK